MNYEAGLRPAAYPCNPAPCEPFMSGPPMQQSAVHYDAMKAPCEPSYLPMHQSAVHYDAMKASCESSYLPMQQSAVHLDTMKAPCEPSYLPMQHSAIHHDAPKTCDAYGGYYAASPPPMMSYGAMQQPCAGPSPVHYDTLKPTCDPCKPLTTEPCATVDPCEQQPIATHRVCLQINIVNKPQPAVSGYRAPHETKIIKHMEYEMPYNDPNLIDSLPPELRPPSGAIQRC